MSEVKNCTMLPVCGFGLAVDTSNIEIGISEERVKEIVDEAVSTIPSGNGISYSLEEQWTGKYWIDGKKIYQKTVDCGVLPNGGEKLIPHKIANIDHCVAMGACAKEERINGWHYYIPHSAHNSYAIAIAINNTNIQIITGVNRPATPNVLSTLQYTCTDR